MEKKVLNYRIIIEPDKYEDGSKKYKRRHRINDLI